MLREIDRHPETNAALLELRELYRGRGETEHVSAVDRMESSRFSPTVSLGWRFGNALELVGYDRKSFGSRQMEITYYWRARRRMAADYAAFVHVHGAQGQFQADYALGCVEHSTRTWQPGETVKQTVHLTLPDDIPVDTYDIDVGVWDPVDHRLLLGPWWHRTKADRLFAVEAKS